MVHVGGLLSLLSLFFMFIWYQWKARIASMVKVRVTHSEKESRGVRR